MNLHEGLARVGATTVAAAAVAGSTSALLQVASGSQLALPWTLPLALDGTALVAAMTIRRRSGDWLAWGALVATAGTSATVQWLTAPPGVPAHLAHVSLPLAALVSFELFLRAVSERPQRRAQPRRRPAPTPVLAEVAPLEQPAAAGDLEAAAREVAAELGRVPGRPTLTAKLKDRGHRLGTARAEALLTMLREEAERCESSAS